MKSTGKKTIQNVSDPVKESSKLKLKAEFIRAMFRVVGQETLAAKANTAVSSIKV